jgi:hypothetical protein
MGFSALPDISENQSLEAAVWGVRERLRFDLSQEKGDRIHGKTGPRQSVIQNADSTG